jgi:hypothetical protein
MKRKIIQIDWETSEIIEKGVLADDCPAELYATLNKGLEDAGINKVWLVEPVKGNDNG